MVELSDKFSMKKFPPMNRKNFQTFKFPTHFTAIRKIGGNIENTAIFNKNYVIEFPQFATTYRGVGTNDTPRFKYVNRKNTKTRFIRNDSSRTALTTRNCARYIEQLAAVYILIFLTQAEVFSLLRKSIKRPI